MKTSEEKIQSVFNRIEQEKIIRSKKNKTAVRISVAVLTVCIAVIVTTGLVRSNYFLKPSSKGEETTLNEKTTENNTSVNAFGTDIQVILKNTEKLPQIDEINDLSVYKNKYPVDNIHLYSQTEAIEKLLKDKLSKYLSVSGAKPKEDEITISESVLEVKLSDNRNITVTPEALTLQFVLQNADDVIISNNIFDRIKDNSDIASMLNYLDIKSYSIRTEYTFYENVINGIDIILTDDNYISGRYINIHISKSGSVWVNAVEPDLTEKADTSLSFVEYKKAETALGEKKENICGVEIVLNENISTYYKIPCYKFYIKASVNAPEGYSIYTTEIIPCFQ